MNGLWRCLKKLGKIVVVLLAAFGALVLILGIDEYNDLEDEDNGLNNTITTTSNDNSIEDRLADCTDYQKAQFMGEYEDLKENAPEWVIPTILETKSYLGYDPNAEKYLSNEDFGKLYYIYTHAGYCNTDTSLRDAEKNNIIGNVLEYVWNDNKSYDELNLSLYNISDEYSFGLAEFTCFTYQLAQDAKCEGYDSLKKDIEGIEQSGDDMIHYLTSAGAKRLIDDVIDQMNNCNESLDTALKYYDPDRY